MDRQEIRMKRQCEVAVVKRKSIGFAVQSATRGRVLSELLGAVRRPQPVIGHLETLIFGLMIKTSAFSSDEVEYTRGTWLWDGIRR